MSKKNSKCKIIGVANQKGGVGKTTYSLILARELAIKNNVLLVDCDGQATLTEMVDLQGHSEYFDEEFLENYYTENSSVKIYDREEIAPLDITCTINKSKVPIKGLHLIPSVGNELFFSAERASGGKDLLLNNYLKKIKHNYDYIIIDSLPSVSTLFNNVLLASDALVIPIQTKSSAIAGANGFIEVIDTIMGDFDKKYDSISILPTMYNMQRSDDKDVLTEIKTDFLDFIKSQENIKESTIQVLDSIPERSVFTNSQAVRWFLQDYIKNFDTGKRDILLLIEKITKKIKKSLKQ